MGSKRITMLFSACQSASLILIISYTHYFMQIKTISYDNFGVPSDPGKRKAQFAKSGQKSCTILTVVICAPPAWLAAWSWSTAGRLPETAWWSPDHVPSATCHARNTLPHGQAGRRVTSTRCPSSNRSVHRWSPIMWGLKCAHHLPSQKT